MQILIAILALVVSAVSISISSYMYHKELDSAEKNYLNDLWDSILDLSHENPRYIDINISENYHSAMGPEERLRYDIYCHKAWGHVKEVVDRGYHTLPKFQVAIQWLVTFHHAWLYDNPAFFEGAQFWDAIDRGKSMPAVILHHRQLPVKDDGEIDWDEIAPKYHSYILSPLNPQMVDDSQSGEPRNTLIRDLRKLPAGSDATESPVIADFGCGVGNIIQPIRDCGFSVVGVDSSAQSLAVAARRAKVLGVDFQSVEGDLRDLELDQTFESIISINSILPEERDDVTRMLETIRKHLDKDSGVLYAILPSFDTTEYLAELWYEQYLNTSGSEVHAQRVVDALKRNKMSDPVSLKYADDGFTQQCYHTPDSIEREFAASGLKLIAPPTKIYYPWELCRRFDYGYFPNADEEIWDWYVKAAVA